MTSTDMLKAELGIKPGVIGATMGLRSGVYFDFLDPQLATIFVNDIAWGLANTCRFGGHSLEFYSVAQHSVLCASLVEPEHQFAALMHDAAEAYTGDMIAPLKQLCPDFKAVERRVEAAVFARFGISTPLHPSIKHADLRMLRTEQRDLTSCAADDWTGLDAYEPMAERIEPMAPEQAAIEWLMAFHRLAPAAVRAVA